MSDYQPGDKLKNPVECPSCGGPAKGSVTKNRGVFVYCRNTINETGEKCGYRGFMGRIKSREMIKEDRRQSDAKLEIEQPAGTEPEYRRERRERDRESVQGCVRNADTAASGDGGEEFAAAPQRASLADGLRHFFTGD